METAKDIIILITGILTVLFHPNLPDTVRWFWFHGSDLLYGSEGFLNTEPAREFRRIKSLCKDRAEKYLIELEDHYPYYLTSRELNLAVEVVSLRLPSYFKVYVKQWFYTEGINKFYSRRDYKKHMGGASI